MPSGIAARARGRAHRQPRIHLAVEGGFQTSASYSTRRCCRCRNGDRPPALGACSGPCSCSPTLRPDAVMRDVDRGRRAWSIPKSVSTGRLRSSEKDVGRRDVAMHVARVVREAQVPAKPRAARAPVSVSSMPRAAATEIQPPLTKLQSRNNAAPRGSRRRRRTGTIWGMPSAPSMRRFLQEALRVDRSWANCGLRTLSATSRSSTLARAIDQPPFRRGDLAAND